MLGSVAEAEDIVQEAFLRYHRAFTGDGQAGPDSPKAYLSAVTTRLFLLHDVFGYGYDEVAEIVGRPASACRQLGYRAQARRGRAAPLRGVAA
jgi:DNA-directed RNA polymerase specialized sigma24 family protein